MIKRTGLLFTILVLSVQSLYSQIKVIGNVTNDEGTTLPFATIYIKEIETGTTTNSDGLYNLLLSPGKYTLVFRHLGYKSAQQQVNVANKEITLDVSLEPESIMLETVEITANMEDPAYTIMRKAIAKSNYHIQQIDSFNARVYIKGSGRIVDSPFFLRKVMEKEGIDSSFTFVSESISEISYRRPNMFKEKVIHVRSSGEDNDTSPMGYIMGSFYQPDIAEAVSPLSPNAFGYYRFEYLGSFVDRQYTISKIKVIPRSRGDDVFEGVINIVEDYWSIYSLDLTTTKMGFKFGIKQIYTPINEIAWLPVSHQIAVDGRFFGIDFEYDYLATVSNYKVIINPDLESNFTVVDENIEEEYARALVGSAERNIQSTQQRLSSGEDVTGKELRKFIKDYEKEELKKSKEPDVIENYSYSVDSLASNSDSTFWVSVRPVPLSSREVTGYKKMDSLVVVEKNEAAGDTLKSGKRKGFHIQDIVLGNSYRFKNKDYLRYYSPIESLSFNTVEGYAFNIRMRYLKKLNDTRRLELIPIARYSFSRKKVIGKGTVSYSYNRGSLRTGTISLSGGKYIYQLNTENPIHPIVNSITTLLFRNNYMKIYESGFVTLSNKGNLMDNLGYTIKVSWSERQSLENTTDHSWVSNSREYTSNNPLNIELANTDFPIHKSITSEVELRYQPWLKYRIRYGRKTPVLSSSPTFTVNYKKGIASNKSDTDFDLLQLGVKYNFRIGVRGRFGFDWTAGKFLNNKNLFFTDFKHFTGNETPFLLTNPVGGYRLLSYYNYSTSQEYFSTLNHYQFRKFLITQIPVLRMTGVRELVFLNYLVTPHLTNYMEIGYGIDNLFRIFRLEGGINFVEGKYNGFGIMVGIATSITSDGDNLSFGF